MRTVLGSIVVAMGWWCAPVWAETPLPEDTPTLLPTAPPATPTATKRGNDDADLFTLQVEVLREAYRITGSESTKWHLLSALEDAAWLSCGGLGKDRGKHSEGCRERLTELLALDSENEVAYCIDVGATEPACGERFERQEVRPFDFGKPAKGGTPLEVDTEEQLREQNARERAFELSSTVRNLEEEVLSGNVGQRSELIAAAEALVRLQCTTYRTVIEKMTPPTPATTRDDATTTSQLGALLTDIKSAEPSTPTPVPSGRQRVRLLAPRCLDALGELNRHSPNHPTAACLFYGSWDPRCLKARAQAAHESAGGRGQAPARRAPRISNEFETF